MRAAELFLILAAVTALAVVPDWPHRHLTEPAYWGMLGFTVVVLALLVHRHRSWRPGGANRRVVLLFLVGLPLIYLAAALVGEAGVGPLVRQSLGLAIWLILAAAARRWMPALWVGCAAHALWDVSHYGRAAYIPDWYVVACIAADLGVAGFVALQLQDRDRDREHPPASRPATKSVPA